MTRIRRQSLEAAPKKLSDHAPLSYLLGLQNNPNGGLWSVSDLSLSSPGGISRRSFISLRNRKLLGSSCWALLPQSYTATQSRLVWGFAHRECRVVVGLPEVESHSSTKIEFDAIDVYSGPNFPSTFLASKSLWRVHLPTNFHVLE